MSLTQGEKKTLDLRRKHFERYCKILEGFVPLRESPTEARLARAYLAWRARAAQEQERQ